LDNVLFQIIYNSTNKEEKEQVAQQLLLR